MTTPGFGAIASAVARTKTEIFRRHFDPDETLRPVETVKASMQCTRCGGLLNYTASAIDGRRSGRCSSAGAAMGRLNRILGIHERRGLCHEVFVKPVQLVGFAS